MPSLDTAATRIVHVRDARLHCQVVGDGPLVIALHGFPDEARTFRGQVPALLDAGYRVALPTLRGYAPSTRAPRYDPVALGADLLGVADALSPGEPVFVVGHDIGALATYAACAMAPGRIAAAATLAVPHLRGAVARWVLPTQMRRSCYIALFQIPGVAEGVVGRRNLAFVDRLWSRWSPSWMCPPAALARVKNGMRGRLRHVLGPYRALRSPAGLRRSAVLMERIAVPGLYLHGEEDGCVGVELAHRVGVGWPAADVQVIDGAGHFLHLERPELVAALIVERFDSVSRSAPRPRASTPRA